MGKLITWLLLNGATLIGVLQSIVKAVKELVTGIVNLLSLFMSSEASESMVTKVRWALNTVDAVLENLKSYLIK